MLSYSASAACGPSRWASRKRVICNLPIACGSLSWPWISPLSSARAERTICNSICRIVVPIRICVAASADRQIQVVVPDTFLAIAMGDQAFALPAHQRDRHEDVRPGHPGRRGDAGSTNLQLATELVGDAQLDFASSWQIGRAVQQECRDRSRMPSSA
eukprot:TRINITY_DN75185_c0_g1_i1.p1 TRINITY_DN75185_c0_g1~~TRINITY_DN75185_c0_g1_i1.p1  ORF type:complete len:158 (-),score=20.62 TRINITY_DN75185_c0_g1_i1:10-483(-)